MNEKNIEIFQIKFNKLEQLLRTRYFDGNMKTSFYNLIVSKSEIDIFSEHLSHIKALINLRNNIAHGDREEYFAIPTDRTIKILTKLLNLFENPPLVGSLILSKPLVAYYNDDISFVVSKMIELDYSQVPVIKDGDVVGIMTLESILKAIWLKGIDINSLHRLKNIDNIYIQIECFKIVDLKTKATDVIRFFDESERNGNPLLAVLVTNTEEIIGIITPYDIVEVYKKVRILE